MLRKYLYEKLKKLYNDITMGLTSDQQLNKRQEEVPAKWTFKKLFSSSPVTALTKHFINPMEILLGYLVLVTGIAVLCGLPIPGIFYVLTIVISAIIAYEKYLRTLTDAIVNINNKKK